MWRVNIREDEDGLSTLLPTTCKRFTKTSYCFEGYEPSVFCFFLFLHFRVRVVSGGPLELLVPQEQRYYLSIQRPMELYIYIYIYISSD